MHTENQSAGLSSEPSMAPLIRRSDIAEEFMACPYCYSERGSKETCCGESHFAKAYIVNGRMFFDFEITCEK